MTHRKRRWPFWLAAFVVLAAAAGVGLVWHPNTPLPDAWNPTKPLAVADPVTPLTQWKLRRALADPMLCRATLDASARAVGLPPIRKSDDCHVTNRVLLSGTSATTIAPIDTSCAIALRLTMWDRHGLQPAAAETMQSSLTRIDQIGSYNCRPIRGSSARMSTHATAQAIDITGFGFADGTEISLLRDWTGDGAKVAFLHKAKTSACRWFVTVLSPDFNALHADHFHLQSVGWGSCR